MARARLVAGCAVVWLTGCGGQSAAVPERDVVAEASTLARVDPAILSRLRTGGLRLVGDRIRSEAFERNGGILLSEVPLRGDGAVAFGFARTIEKQIQLRAAGTLPSVASIDHGSAVHRDLYPSTDAITVASDDALEILYLLRDRRAPTSFTWTVTLPPQLPRVSSADDGGLEIADTSGELRLRVPRPFVIDARGVRRAARIDARAERWTLSFDPEGLQYPVLVDPIVEATVWKHDGLPPAPSSTSYAVAHGGKILILANGGTWEWDGTSYALKGAAPAGVADGAGIASLGSRVVLFGGRNDSMTSLGDTWEWDGTSWSKKTLTVQPTPRFGPAMTTYGGKVLLFGGGNTDETWTYDGTKWEQLFPLNTPPPRTSGVMGTTATSALLFGGSSNDDTWEWNGTDWASRGTLSSGMAWDPVMTTVGADTYLVLHGAPPATFKWSGSAWSKLTSVTTPLFANRMPMVTLGTKAVIVGGTRQTTQTFDGSSWTAKDPIYPSLLGTTEYGTKLIGFDSYGYTWTYDGTAWTKTSAPMTFAAVAGREFGAATLASTPWMVRGDTYSWDGTKWVAHMANLNSGEGFAVASLTGDLFAFGGSSAPNVTQKWTGSAWSSMSPTSPPPGRAFHAMEELGGKIIMFGGENRSAPSPRFLTDLWKFDGVNWSAYSGTRPTIEGEPGLSRLATVLALVLQPRPGPGSPEVWTWDGTSLTKKTTSVTPVEVSSSTIGSIGSKAYVIGSRSVATGVDIATMWSLAIARADASDCTSNSECASGFCVDRLCCDTACSGTCQACTAALKGTGSDGVCGLISAGRDPQSECKDEGSPTCGTDGTCDGAGACRKYSGTGCTPRACSDDAECSSGFCTDGICCDRRCDSSCEGCTKALKGSGVDGVCAAFAAGTDPKDKCAKDTAENSCNQDGFCNGTGLCRAYAPKGTACGSTTCKDASVSGRACDGAGTCETATSACGAFLCEATGTACRTTCTADSDCATTAYCDGSGVCKAKSSNGTKCTMAKECTSGLCVDGVCCNEGCGAQCESCNEAGKEGSCVPVSGKPRGAREACTGEGTPCGGKCDGSGTSCTYPSAATDCGSTCAGSSLTKRVCDNKGSCVESTTSCGTFACGDKACKDTCATAADCAGSGYQCEATKCVPAGGASCTEDGLSVKDGDKITACTPAVCKGGACVQRCLGSTDCATSFTCDPATGNCVASTAPVEEEGGCAMHRSSRGASGSFVLLAFVALALRRSKKRR